jgi:5'-nucleotidase
MRILLTNDDGVLSPVLHTTAEALAREHEVVVAAPALDQSGTSHSFTHGVDRLLTCHRETSAAYPVYRVDGTPSDCVKFAIAHLLKDTPPDLVVSGPNLGENAGISAVYSGTVAAAREAALWNIPGIALSLSNHGQIHLDYALAWLMNLLRKPDVLPAPGTLWNINVPGCPPEDIAGARFTAMSTVMFRDHYEEVATPHGIPGHLLRGHKPAEQFVAGTDDDLLRRNFIAVTPLRISQGDEAALALLRAREARLNEVSVGLPHSSRSTAGSTGLSTNPSKPAPTPSF